MIIRYNEYLLINKRYNRFNNIYYYFTDDDGRMRVIRRHDDGMDITFVIDNKTNEIVVLLDDMDILDVFGIYGRFNIDINGNKYSGIIDKINKMMNEYKF